MGPRGPVNWMAASGREPDLRRRLASSHFDPKRPFKAEVYRRKQAHCEPGRSERKQSGHDQYVEGAWAMDAFNPVQLDV